jgi:tetratricopeptide (TPR) repeat protein
MVIMMVIAVMAVGCASTIDEKGRAFDHKSGTIVVGQTTKRQVQEVYGEPTGRRVVGKYEIMEYYYSKESFKHGRAVGMGFLSAIPGVGLATLAMDQGVKDSDIAKEQQKMVVWVDLATGVVKDYYYHDNNGRGHDESETLFLSSLPLQQQGKTQEMVATLEKAVFLNENNHRALNNLAWALIDLNIDVDKGVSYAERAVKVFPDSPYNNGTLGCGYMKKGDKASAEKYLIKANALYPLYAPSDQRAISHNRAMLELLGLIRLFRAFFISIKPLQ